MDYRDNRPATRKGGPYCTPIWGPGSTPIYSDEGYAREELVAELGAAFLAADLGLCIEPRPDHASYIASWIKVLQNDTRAIVQAATHAERAVAFLHQLANPEAIREAA